MKMVAVLFCFMFFFQGCIPAISPGMADRADRTVHFEKLQVDPDSFEGKIIIAGGTIVQASEVRQGTLIEVIQRPLDYWDKPVRTKQTGGRFLVLHPGRLNMMAYAPGVDITIAGEVLGTGSPLINGAQYDYPVLFAKEMKLWEREPRAGDKPQWMDPLHDPARTGRPQ